MGFYLPGIGEAIGGALRMQRQQELMAQSQSILQDSSKPWSERVALITAAHPELATNPQLQAMLEAGRQADADKMQRTQYERQQRDLAENDQFRALYDRLPENQRDVLLKNNPDMASRVYPEMYKAKVAAETAAAKEAEWLRHNEITSGQADRRAAVAADAASGRNLITMFSQGVVDASGRVIPPQEQAAAKQQQTLSTEQAKLDQKQAQAEKIKQQQQQQFAAGLIDYRDRVLQEGATGGFGADEKSLMAQRNILVNQLARQMSGGNAEPNPGVVKAAESMIPETSILFAQPDSFRAAINEVIRAQGIDPDMPPLPPGFQVVK